MLVSMKEIMEHAYEEGYCVIAPNFMQPSDVVAEIEVAEEMNCPIILDYVYNDNIEENAAFAIKMAKKAKVPVCINQDHGKTDAENMAAIRMGFTGIMCDRSVYKLEENIARVKHMTEIAHSLGIGVEGELGHVGSNGVSQEDQSLYTDPQEAKKYVEETGIDQLAISIGTAHGTYAVAPTLQFDVLKAVKEAVNVPLVLHGSSGSGDDQLARCCKEGINKMNVYTDLATAAINAVQGVGVDQMMNYWQIYYDAFKARLRDYIEFSGSKGKAFTPKNGGYNGRQIIFVEHDKNESI